MGVRGKELYIVSGPDSLPSEADCGVNRKS
jgi:hypothetical protein